VDKGEYARWPPTWDEDMQIEWRCYGLVLRIYGIKYIELKCSPLQKVDNDRTRNDEMTGTQYPHIPESDRALSGKTTRGNPPLIWISTAPAESAVYLSQLNISTTVSPVVNPMFSVVSK